MLDREDSNPWEHIQNYGFFTYERMYFYNPWYHSEEHDPLVESGEKGYISGEDPFDTRHNAGYSEMASFSLAVVGIVLYAMSYTEHSADVEMYLQRSTLEYV